MMIVESRSQARAAKRAARPARAEAPPRAHEGQAGEPETAASSGSVRTCIGCGKKIDPRDLGEPLAKIVRGPALREGGPIEIAIDPAGARGTFGGGSLAGRGAHVHATAACVRAAAASGLSRSFKAAVAIDGERVTPAALAAAIRAVEDRKLAGMIVAAARAKRAVVGAEPVRAALRSESAKLVVVATDAQAAADLSEVRRAVASGHAVAWGTKAILAELAHGKAPRASGADGEMAEGAGVGVIAILDPSLAGGIQRAVAVADGLSPLLGGGLVGQTTGTPDGGARAAGNDQRRHRRPERNDGPVTSEATSHPKGGSGSSSRERGPRGSRGSDHGGGVSA